MKALSAILGATLLATAGSVTALPLNIPHARDDRVWQLQFESYENCDDVSASHWTTQVYQVSNIIMSTVRQLPDYGGNYLKWRSLDGYPGTVQFGYTLDDGSYGAWEDSVEQGACITPNGYTAVVGVI